MSSFYYRAGIYQSSNKPYYKLLSLPAPTWGSYASHAYQGPGGHTGASGSGYTSTSVSYPDYILTDSIANAYFF